MGADIYLTILQGITEHLGWLVKQIVGKESKPDPFNLMRSVTWNG
jgi:hypothetical protein